MCLRRILDRDMTDYICKLIQKISKIALVQHFICNLPPKRLWVNVSFVSQPVNDSSGQEADLLSPRIV